MASRLSLRGEYLAGARLLRLSLIGIRPTLAAMDDEMLRLEIENFRGVKRGELELPRASIILGANNSGKTTILEAIYLLPGPCRKTPAGVPLDIVHELHATLDSTGYAFLLRFYRKIRASIRAELDGRRWELTMDPEDDLIFLRTFSYPAPGEEKKEGRVPEESCRAHRFSRVWELTREHSDVLDGVDAFLTYRRKESARESFPESLFYHPDLRKVFWDKIRRRWAETAELTREVARQLDSLVGQGALDLTLEPYGGEAPQTHSLYLLTRAGKVRLGDVGSGVQGLATLMLLYAMTKPRYVLIDDVESHLNPSALLFLASWLYDRMEEDKISLVVATHSIEAASVLLATLEDFGAAVTIVGLKDGVLKGRTLTREQFEELKAAGVDVRVSEGILL